MKTSVEDRFSNVIAWLGLLLIIPAVCPFWMVTAQTSWAVIKPSLEYDHELQQRCMKSTKMKTFIWKKGRVTLTLRTYF